MMMMEPSSIELKVMSSNGLKAFNFCQKLCVYVKVSIVSEDPSGRGKKRYQQQKTPTDREGNGDPEWKHEMRFDLKGISSPSNHDRLFLLEFDLICEALVLGNKTIGQVRVPFKDLIEEFNGAARFVSYQVRSPDGKPNGVLNFSYKLIGLENKIGIEFPIFNNNDYSVMYPPSSICYPTVDIHHPPPPEVLHHHPPPEVYYPPPQPSAPPPPAADMVYYPPPHPSFYPPQPAPHGFEVGGYSSSSSNSNPQFAYPANWGQPAAPPPYGREAWNTLPQQRDRSGGSWSFRYRY